MIELLSRVGWTKAELARRLEISESTVRGWCRGSDTAASRAAVKWLESIARCMGV